MTKFVQGVDHFQCFPLCSRIISLHIVQQMRGICDWLIALIAQVLNQHGPTVGLDASICTWNSLSHGGDIKIGASTYLRLMVSQAY